MKITNAIRKETEVGIDLKVLNESLCIHARVTNNHTLYFIYPLFNDKKLNMAKAFTKPHSLNDCVKFINDMEVCCSSIDENTTKWKIDGETVFSLVDVKDVNTVNLVYCRTENGKEKRACLEVDKQFMYTNRVKPIMYNGIYENETCKSFASDSEIIYTDI